MSTPDQSLESCRHQIRVLSRVDTRAEFCVMSTPERSRESCRHGIGDRAVSTPNREVRAMSTPQKSPRLRLVLTPEQEDQAMSTPDGRFFASRLTRTGRSDSQGIKIQQVFNIKVHSIVIQPRTVND